MVNKKLKINSLFHDNATADRRDQLEGGYLEESAIIQMLMQRFPATQVHSLIDNLKASGAIKIAKNTGKAEINARGFRRFVAGDKTGLL